LGKQRVRQRLVEALRWRERLTDAFTQHPEITTEPLSRAVVIVAPFRTGTTFLHRLLATDARFQWVRPWEMLYAPATLRGADEEQRRQRFRRDLQNLYRLQPELADLHPMSVDGPDECFGLLDSTLLSPSLLFYAPLLDYLTWLESVDETAWDAAYRQYAQHLRVLTWLARGEQSRPWLLKNPVHLGNLGALRRAIHGAVFVHLHRDAASAVRSFCRLLELHYAMSLRTTDSCETGKVVRRFYEFALPRAVATRRSEPSLLDVDIAFDALIRDPIGAIRPIYDAARMDLNATVEQQMRAWLKRTWQPTPSAGPALDTYGLSETGIRQLFAEYAAFEHG
jgi:hypothetical protein